MNKIIPIEYKNNDITHLKAFKEVFKNTWPSMVLLLFVGLYFFVDDLISINFASKNYSNVFTKDHIEYKSVTMVRLALSTSMPIYLTLEGVAFIFSIGSSVFYARAIGENNNEKAKNILKSSFKISFLAAFIFMPVIILLIKPWFSYQYDADVHIKEIIWKMTFEYSWITCLALPFLMFNQYISANLRAEFKNIMTLWFLLSGLIINLIFDIIFMDTLSMGIDGGAWATFLSFGLNSLFYVLYLHFTKKETFLKLKILFDFKNLKFAFLGAIILIGLSPFIRNVSQAFTETIEAHNLSNMGQWVYSNDSSLLSSMFSNIIIIYNIFIPMLFGFMQGIIPIIAYHFQRKERKILNKIMIWSFIQSFLIAWIGYGIMSGLSPSILDVMQISSVQYPLFKEKSIIALKIIGLTIPFYAIFVCISSYFIGTNKILLSIFSSAFRGFIIIFPIINHFNGIIEDNFGFLNNYFISRHNDNWTSLEYKIWWIYPVAILSTLAIIIPLYLLSFYVWDIKDHWRKKYNLSRKLNNKKLLKLMNKKRRYN